MLPIQLFTQLTTTTPEGETDTITQNLRANLFWRTDGTWTIRYIDTDNKGVARLEKTSVHLLIHRKGRTESQNTFVVGTQQVGFYSLPEGKIDLTTFTHSCEESVTAAQGRLTIAYDLCIGNEKVAHNCLEISWQGVQ